MLICNLRVVSYTYMVSSSEMIPVLQARSANTSSWKTRKSKLCVTSFTCWVISYYFRLKWAGHAERIRLQHRLQKYTHIEPRWIVRTRGRLRTRWVDLVQKDSKDTQRHPTIDFPGHSSSICHKSADNT